MSSQPPPLPPPLPQTQETQEPGPHLDSEGTSKEARVAALQAWTASVEEHPRAPEPPQGQGSPIEVFMFMAAAEEAILAALLESAIADPNATDTLSAATIETNTAAADTAVANTATPASSSLINLWPGHGDGISALQAEPRSPTAPLGSEVTLVEVRGLRN